MHICVYVYRVQQTIFFLTFRNVSLITFYIPDVEVGLPKSNNFRLVLAARLCIVYTFIDWIFIYFFWIIRNIQHSSVMISAYFNAFDLFIFKNISREYATRIFIYSIFPTDVIRFDVIPFLDIVIRGKLFSFRTWIIMNRRE